MSAFSLSKFHPTQWLATLVTCVLTWPMALALSLASERGRMEEEATVDASRPASPSEVAGHEFDANERFTHGYFGRYRW